jgi:hypothetical protein
MPPTPHPTPPHTRSRHPPTHPPPPPQALRCTRLGGAPEATPERVDPRRLGNLAGQVPFQIARSKGHAALAELLHPDLPLSFVLDSRELEQVRRGNAGNGGRAPPPARAGDEPALQSGGAGGRCAQRPLAPPPS